MPFLRGRVSEFHSVRMGFKSEHPVEVAHIVTHAVGVTGVDEQLDSVVQERDEKGCRVVHSIALEEECLVDLHIAAFEVAFNWDAERTLHLLLVEPLVDVGHLFVAEISILLTIALLPQVIRVQAEVHQRRHELRVAVQAGWNAAESASRVVAALDQVLASCRLGVERSALGAFGIQGSVWSFTQVVWNTGVLSPGLGETVSEDETLERNVMEILDHIGLLNA